MFLPAPRLSVTVVVLACTALCGCESFNQAINPRAKVDLAQPLYVAPQGVETPPVNNGAIFQAGQYRPLFEDHRARLVGDALTVQIVEKVSATQSSTVPARSRRVLRWPRSGLRRPSGR